MRKIYLSVIFFLSVIMVQCQVNDTIYLSFTKTAFLIFSQPVNDAVIGSENVLVKINDNKIIAQAAQENFEETNLMVQTGGKYYMFIVHYSNSPKRYLYNYQEQNTDSEKDKEPVKVVVDKMAQNETKKEELKTDSLKKLYLSGCKKVEKSAQEFYDLAETKGGVTLVLANMYVDDNLFYFRVDVINNSKIRYDIDYYQFAIRNKKKVLKKTPIQDKVIEPFFVANNVKVIEAKGKNSFIFVLPKFTIQDKKKLFIEFWENKGDRNFSISLHNIELLKIKKIEK